MHFHVVIPARYASSRLPGKPLADIGGRPMVLRVLERALAKRAQSRFQSAGALRKALATCLKLLGVRELAAPHAC